MNIFRKIDEILASLGNVKAMKRTHVDTFTEERIKNVVGERYGVSEFGSLYIEYQELAGYFFLNTTIISDTDFKTNKGSTLLFASKTKELVFSSDDYMIESDFSNVSNRWITKINYPLSKDELQLIRDKKFNSIIFKVKKYKIEFNLDN